MVTDEVIKEIYKKYKKPPKSVSVLKLDYFVHLLAPYHRLAYNDKEVILEDLEEFNPFRRFLLRSINAVLELDKLVAFVFRNHIVFLGKEDNSLRIHMKPEKPRNIFSKIFGR